jgi:hypothetical protein
VRDSLVDKQNATEQVGGGRFGYGKLSLEAESALVAPLSLARVTGDGEAML